MFCYQCVVLIHRTDECRVDSMDRLKAKCATLEGEIRDPARLKDFYQFAFNYAKNPGQKCLGMYIDYIFVNICLSLCLFSKHVTKDVNESRRVSK